MDSKPRPTLRTLVANSASETIRIGAELAAESSGAQFSDSSEGIEIDVILEVVCGQTQAAADGVRVLDLAQSGSTIGQLVRTLSRLGKPHVAIELRGELPLNEALATRLHELLCELATRLRGSAVSKRKAKGANAKAVERLFPFVRRAGIIVLGQDNLKRSKSKLHFLLLASDLSVNGQRAVYDHFSECCLIQHFTSAELQELLGKKGVKVVGFLKSALATSLYRELKPYRIELE